MCDSKIKIIRTDNGSEYMNNALKEYLLQQGIRHDTTQAYSPECLRLLRLSKRALKLYILLTINQQLQS